MVREKIKGAFRREPVLCISAMLAAGSCFFVRPDAGYAKYVDLRTIALLYCLMVVVSGLRRAGVFRAAGAALCARAKNGRVLALVLTLLCFFCSMLITNDVALITFVPFTAAMLGTGGRPRLMLGITVLETMAANLGSALTPIGNPQNLYLYSYYDMSLGAFLRCTAPVCAVSLALLCVGCLLLPPEALPAAIAQDNAIQKRPLVLSTALFALCLAVVLRLLPWYAALPLLVLALLIFDRSLLLQADFMLLLTFVCFFVFAGNLSRLESVNSVLRRLIAGRELLGGALISQAVSNVPAAVLLSNFTENGPALLLGVNIGGLGTPVASLASLISLKYYAATPERRMGRYMAVFLASGFALLAVLLGFARAVLF